MLCWWDHEQRAMFLCHFDKETLLHEVGHALSSGYHGDPWAKATARLYQKYLKGNELTEAMTHLGTTYLVGVSIKRSTERNRQNTKSGQACGEI